MFSLLFLTLGGWMAFRYIQKNFSVLKGSGTGVDKKINIAGRGILIVLITLILALFPPIKGELINSGHVGVKFNKWGSDRGVSRYTYASGYIVYFPLMTYVKEFTTAIRHIEYDTVNVLTKGGYPAIISPTFNVQLKAEHAADMYVNLRQDLEVIDKQWLKTCIIGSVMDISAQWSLDSILNNRSSFEDAITRECNKRIGRWFMVDAIKTCFTPDAAIINSIKQKTEALQLVQIENNRAQAAIATKTKNIALAQADSADKVIRAAGEAEAINRLQTRLSPIYIEYIRAKGWNGQNPTTVLTPNSGAIIQLPK